MTVMRCSIPLLAAALAAPLAACGYTPPAHTDTEAPQYQADLDTCQSSVPDAVDRNNAKKGLTWIAGGATRWFQIDTAMDNCMADKGWGHTRACTAEELRSHTGNQTVTRDGIRCSDPSKPS
jgi:hypothetical protein